ncbi:MAG TPA: nucleoside hydrolase-like domain-containing protein [Chloroflexota bacterium]|nr:nucleoside hydrolase-like domain-containing protein [Chloroflexota bacterium]
MYRVLVSTDLGGDPDDIQSLYRVIHYSDLLRIEGIVSVTGPGAKNSAEKVRHWVQRVDVDHLRANGHPELTGETDLLAKVKQGAMSAGGPTAARRTEGSDWIIACAHAHDSRSPSARGGAEDPLWVLCWGSMTDVAQALHDDPAIAPKIRVYVIGSSNTGHDPESRDYVYEFMRSHYPQLWWIENGIMPKRSHDTFRGVYLGGNQEGEWSNVEFITHNIRGRGSRHNGLFDERCGDAFPVATSPAGTLKEGDSPSFLYLLSPHVGGVGNVDDPTQESWGGQFRRPEPHQFPNYYVDLDADAATCQATINRWRVDFLADWKRRWEWYGQDAK